MIKHYTTIKPELKEKNVYVWDVGIKCLYVFSHLACRGINVKGFVTNLDDYIGASICNRPVVSPEEYMADEKGIVITHDAVGPNSFRLVSGYGDAYRYSDVMVINEELKNKDYYLYGTGQRAWQVLKELNDRDMQIKGFIESNAGIRNQLMGVPVSTPDTIHSHAQDVTIIADARSEKMQARLNLSIKYRESFRPFAPAVLRERCSDYFDVPETRNDLPYMLICADVVDREDLDFDMRGKLRQDGDLLAIVNRKRSEIPAVTHVDYSARVQTVDEETNPFFYSVLKSFEKRTGCGVVINTSFNVRGEPIVCSPEDAYHCFMNTEMDMLVLRDFVLYKDEQPEQSRRRDRYELD